MQKERNRRFVFQFLQFFRFFVINLYVFLFGGLRFRRRFGHFRFFCHSEYPLNKHISGFNS